MAIAITNFKNFIVVSRMYGVVPRMELLFTELKKLWPLESEMNDYPFSGE